MRLATILLLFLAVPLAAQPTAWTLLGGPHHGALPLVVTPDGLVAYTAVGAEVFRSLDGGGTWTPFGTPDAEVLDLRLGAGGTLVAGTAAGVFRGADGAWTSLGLGHRVSRVGEAGGVLYASHSPHRFARSTDGGATWVERTITDIPHEYVFDLHLGTDGMVFASLVNAFMGFPTYYVAHSADGGDSWTRLQHTGQRFLETPDGSVFAVTPEYPPDRWVVTPKVSRFTGGGWETVAEGEFTGASVLADGTILPAPADGFAGGPAPGRLPRPTLVAPTASGAWLAATEANGLFRWTEETGWRQVPLGPVEVSLLAERADGTLVAGSGVALLEYGETGWRTGAWVRGAPEGVAFEGERTLVASLGRPYDVWAGAGLYDTDHPEALHAIFGDPGPVETATGILRTDSGLVATLGWWWGGDTLGSIGPYRSTDGGATWQQSHGPWATSYPPCDLRTLAAMPDGTLWAASRARPDRTEDPFCVAWTQGLYRSTDAGATWMAAGEGFPGPEATAFAWRGGDTYAASPGGGVFRLGAADVWAPFGLEGIPVHDLGVSTDGALLAATDTGLLAHDGVNWVGIGLDGVVVQKLYVREGGEVYAATDAGLYRSDGPLAVAGEPAAPPSAFLLGGIYPNPARTSSAVTFSLPEAGSVRVTVYDLLGRPVLASEDGPFPPGQHHVTLAPLGLPVGTYVVEVRAGAARAVARWTWLGP